MKREFLGRRGLPHDLFQLLEIDVHTFGFVMFVLLITIREAVETILDELRKAGVLPPEDD